MIKKTYKFRLYPTEVQANKIRRNIGACRFIYNKLLADRNEYYEKTGKMLYNAPEHYKKEIPWLKEVDAVALQWSAKDLNQAYKNFFNHPKKYGKPSFKSKHKERQTYTTTNNNGCMYFTDKFHIKLPKMGEVKLRGGRQIPQEYKIKHATIEAAKSGKFYIMIIVEYENQIPTKNLDINNTIGLDYSSPRFYIDSNGNSPEYPKFFRQNEERLAKEQRKLSQMVRGSSNYDKQKIKVARIHEHIKNCRLDFIHKLSRKLANYYDYVFVEDINLLNLAQTLKLGKSTNDNGLGMFRMFLKYKLEEQSKVFFKISKFDPSSKTCNNCGHVNKELQLSDHVWICPNCGKTIDRDLNAAKNIKDMGIKELFLNKLL